MTEITLGEIESRFADIIWEKAPLSTNELVRLCAEAFGWKRTTAYTVLKRLCGKGLFRMENSEISVIIPRDEFYSGQSRRIVDTSFGGSLPAFIAAFSAGKPLSEKEIAEIKELIDRFGKENGV